MPKYSGILASSSDPSGQTLSLTIESFSKVLIGMVGWYGISHVGFDAATAQTQLQGIIDLVAQSVPMIFALWHACMMLWGLVRKFLGSFKKSPILSMGGYQIRNSYPTQGPDLPKSLS